METIALSQADNSPDYGGDRELARRCASGDERALREVFETHEPLLRKLITRNLGSREDAEELVATTFLRFWKSARHYRGTSSLRSYLTRIALNLCHDASRKRRPVTIPEPIEWPQEENPLADRIRQSLLQLEREDRELLSLYYLEDWDYQEICDSLGITYDVLRTRLVRARKKLRTLVEETND
jgi:RNA polymerase sigma-70 factor (ECF subfamily)